MNEQADHQRTLLIDAICSQTFGMTTCDMLTKHGYMKYTGNQWNENWSWERKKLEEQSIERLERIYAASKRGWLIMSDIR